MKLIGRVEPVLHLQGYLNTVPGGVYAPEDETNVTYIVRDKTGEEVPSELVEEESTAATKIIQLLVAIGGSTTDEELAEIEAEVDRLLNETDPVELGNLAGHSIVNKIRLAQIYRDEVISAIEEKGISAADEQPFRTVADLVKQIIRQAKTVTPTTEQQIVVPDEGVYGLESVTVEGVQLQEINVWSTDTEQVITPDEGYMGFSKVIVDAVESGGGWGDDYGGAVEDNTWGDEYTDTDVPTGNLDYSGGENPNYIPPIPGGDNQILLDKEKEEGSQTFQYYRGEDGWEVQASKPVLTGALFGAYYLSDYGYYARVIWYVCYSDEHFTIRTRGLDDLIWSDGNSQNLHKYGDGYVYFLRTTTISGGDPDMLEDYNTPSGIPLYRIGTYQTDGELFAARDNQLRSLIGGIETEGVKQYIAFSSDSPIRYDGAYVTNADGSPINVYEYDPEGSGEWVQIGTTDGSGYPVGNYDRVWNSHDIKDENGTVTYPKSDDPIPEMSNHIPVERNGTYSVDGNTMNGLVGAAQKVTGSTTPLSPTEATSALDDYMANPAEEMKW